MVPVILTMLLAAVPTLDASTALEFWHDCTVLQARELDAVPAFTVRGNAFVGTSTYTAVKPKSEESISARLTWTIAEARDMRGELQGDADLSSDDYAIRTEIEFGGRIGTGYTALAVDEHGAEAVYVARHLGVRDSEGRWFPARDGAGLQASLFLSVGLTMMRSNVIVLPPGETPEEK